ERICDPTGFEPGLSTCGADRPTGLRLMAGETSASVGPEILKERVSCLSRATVGLEGRDLPAGVRVDTELWDIGRRRLRTPGGIFELAHLLSMSDCARRPIQRLRGIDDPRILRQDGRKGATERDDRQPCS